MEGPRFGCGWRSLSRTTETRIAVYTVRFEKALYVLHAFQKKSPSGIRSAKRDVDLVEQRLKQAQRDYEEHYAKTTR
jgi:phage-related protein